MTEIKIGNTLIGDGHPCYVVAEVGINHNGEMEIAKRLIDVAVSASCCAVKFQKRTVDVVYSAEELARLRESPFGETNGDLKHGLEFGLDEYQEIDRYCKEKNIAWFASCWDEASVDFIARFEVPCYKIASASLTDDNLLRHTRAQGKPIMLSTGMSTLEQVNHAVELLGKENLVVMHTTSTYPAMYEELNLKVIPMLRQRYNVLVGYSGHETGLSLPSPRWYWAPAWWSGISPLTAQCGVRIKLLRWNPRGLTGSSAIFAWSKRPWATA